MCFSFGSAAGASASKVALLASVRGAALNGRSRCRQRDRIPAVTSRPRRPAKPQSLHGQGRGAWSASRPGPRALALVPLPSRPLALLRQPQSFTSAGTRPVIVHASLHLALPAVAVPPNDTSRHDTPRTSQAHQHNRRSSALAEEFPHPQRRPRNNPRRDDTKIFSKKYQSPLRGNPPHGRRSSSVPTRSKLRSLPYHEAPLCTVQTLLANQHKLQ